MVKYLENRLKYLVQNGVTRLGRTKLKSDEKTRPWRTSGGRIGTTGSTTNLTIMVTRPRKVCPPPLLSPHGLPRQYSVTTEVTHTHTTLLCRHWHWHHNDVSNSVTGTNPLLPGRGPRQLTYATSASFLNHFVYFYFIIVHIIIFIW